VHEIVFLSEALGRCECTAFLAYERKNRSQSVSLAEEKELEIPKFFVYKRKTSDFR